MNVETSTAPAPRSTDGRRPDPVEPGQESAQPFAALLTAVHRGFGQQVFASVAGLHHQAELPGSSEGDARGGRLEEMSDRADARAAAGPGSRLAIGNAAGDSSGGPMGHRLALQAEQQAQEASTKLDDASDRAGRKDEAGVPQRSKTGLVEERATATNKVAEGGTRAAGRSDSTLTTEGSGSTKAAGDSNDQPRPQGPSITQTGSSAEGRPDLARVDRMVAPAQKVHSPTPGKASASSASGRVVTVEGPRAVAGAEQTGQGRTTGDSSAQTSGSRSGERTLQSREVAEHGTEKQSARLSRTEFDRLVRTIRMNVGRRQSTARLHLRPPELGRLRIDTRMTGNRLEVQVQAESSATRQLLQSRLADLQAALERHGIQVDRLALTVLAPESEGQPSGLPIFDDQPDSQQSQLAQDADHSERQQRSDQASKSEPLPTAMEQGDQELLFTAAAETRLDLQA